MDTSEKLKDMKERFDTRLRQLISMKGQNSQIFTKKAYLENIEKVKVSKKKTTNKKPEDYQRLKRFDVLTIGNIEKLIVPVKQTDLIKFYVHTEEIFQILHETHLTLGHAGRTKMSTELSTRFKNITREMISLYLNLCQTCEKKPTPKSFRPKPASQDCTTKCQVELIEMEPDNGYKFILIYQDHETKFVQLRPLKTQNFDEIADVLLDIFTIFGAPCVLLNSIGRELADNIIKQLYAMWPLLKMVHGPENEAVDLVTDVKKRLNAWLGGNTKKWTEGLRFVQLIKNVDNQSDGNAYEAMFGTKMRIGLKALLPEDVISSINSEEELESYLTAGEVPIDSSESDILKLEDHRNLALASSSQEELTSFASMDIKIEDSLIMKMDHDALEDLP